MVDDTFEPRDIFDATVYDSSARTQELRFVVSNMLDNEWNEVALQLTYNDGNNPIDVFSFDGTDATGNLSDRGSHGTISEIFLTVFPSFDLPDATAKVQREDQDLIVSFSFSTPASLSMIGNWNAAIAVENGDMLTGAQTFIDAISKNDLIIINTSSYSRNMWKS